ncbi:MAG: hypothetical protein KY475_23100 [Planctomycetes bacterium]|nr:hypothetical protein [Planctomycetota bacterium]
MRKSLSRRRRFLSRFFRLEPAPKTSHARHRQRRLRGGETLEERRLLATVTVSGPTEDAWEGGSAVNFTVHVDQQVADPLVVPFTISGSAIEGGDFDDIGDSVTIPAGTTSADIAISALIDNDFEPDEFVTITLNSDPSFTVGTPGSATGVIIHCSGFSAGPRDVPQTCPACGGPGDAATGAANPLWAGGSSFWAGGSSSPWGGNSILAGGSSQGNGGYSGTMSPPFWNPGAAAGGNNGGVAYNFSPPGESSEPVRYADGVVIVSSRDLESHGMGAPWGVTRSWTNAQAQYRQNIVGTRMLLTQQPYIYTGTGSSFFVFSNSHITRGFDLLDGVYHPRDFAQETLVHDATTHEFIFTDTEGGVIRFYDLSTNHPALKQGQDIWVRAVSSTSMGREATIRVEP